MRIGGKSFTLQDLIDEEMLDCLDTELTFKLISFAHYLESDAVLRSCDGQSWSIPRLINAEIKAPIRVVALRRCASTVWNYLCVSNAANERMPDRRRIPSGQAIHYVVPAIRLVAAEPRRQLQHRVVFPRGNRPDMDRKIQNQRAYP